MKSLHTNYAFSEESVGTLGKRWSCDRVHLKQIGTFPVDLGGFNLNYYDLYLVVTDM